MHAHTHIRIQRAHYTVEYIWYPWLARQHAPRHRLHAELSQSCLICVCVCVSFALIRIRIRIGIRISFLTLHTHTRAHAHMCMTALRHMYVFCIRFGFGFEFWIWNRCQSFDGFPFFVFFAASSASFSICLINIRHSRQQCDFSRLSSLFISVCLSPWPLFLCCFVVISVKSFQLSRTQHRYCNRIRSGKRIYRLWTSRIRSVWPQRIYCCAALRSAAVLKAWGVALHTEATYRLCVCVCVWLFGHGEGGFCFKWSVTNGH